MSWQATPGSFDRVQGNFAYKGAPGRRGPFAACPGRKLSFKAHTIGKAAEQHEEFMAAERGQKNRVSAAERLKEFKQLGSS